MPSTHQQEDIFVAQVVVKNLGVKKPLLKETIKEINDRSKIYLVSCYYPYSWVDGEYERDVNEVFALLNDSIRDISEASEVYYVDISEVSKEEYLFDKYQIYLNQMGHEYVFSVFRNNYFY